MTKKKITLELSNNDYLNLLKIISIGEFAMQGHKTSTEDTIYKMLSSIYKHAKEFNCEDLVDEPFLIDDSYEVDVEYMARLIDETFDIEDGSEDEDMRFMLKQSENETD
jgi:hypothetical protein